MSSHPECGFSEIPSIVVKFPNWNWSGQATTPSPIMMSSTSLKPILN
jgi:hypothetical protein